MKARTVTTTLAVVTVLVIIGIVVWESARLTSPGPLHGSHAAVASLQGAGSCAACHGSGEQTMAQACVVCHEVIDGQRRTQTGLHGSLEPETWTNCAACHIEHVDGTVPLVSDAAFERSGIDNRTGYQHQHTAEFFLEGAHDALSCERCHTYALSPALPEGHPRYLGLDQQCTTCHQDPHNGELPNCVDCHGQSQPFAAAPGFNHSSFPLKGGHAIADCRTCHESDTYAGLDTSCIACHESDFRSALNPSHTGLGFDTDCASCHSIDSWQSAAFVHIAAFPLTDSHAGLGCAACHTEDPSHLESLAGATCAACHDSPHSDSFVVAVASLVGVASPDATCQACHSPKHAGFRLPEATMTPEQHAATGFPLIPPHDGQQCAQCHTQAEDAAWIDLFPGRLPEECQLCHGDPHNGQFDRSITEGRCLDCHQPTRFEPSLYDVDMHARSAFPLTGAHRATPCSACHLTDAGEMRFVPTPTACSACHEDIHEGRFDAPSLPASIQGKTDCARCHVTAGFDSVAWSGEDHAIWTGYELLGAHEQLACSACHAIDQSAPLGQRFDVPTTDCAACHADTHAGQFLADGQTDCARCHAESSFSDLHFVHNRDARFSLDEHHASLACAECHQSIETISGPVVRYRPLGTECIDCHGSPEGP